MGKPDDKLFDSIPKSWSVVCQDFNLGLFYYPVSTKIILNQSSEITISLVAPPHRINRNDTVSIQWIATQFIDCVTWEPKGLTFNTNSFQEEQRFTITRVKDGPQTTLSPIFYGGGFELVPPAMYHIFIQ